MTESKNFGEEEVMIRPTTPEGHTLGYIVISGPMGLQKKLNEAAPHEITKCVFEVNGKLRQGLRIVFSTLPVQMIPQIEDSNPKKAEDMSVLADDQNWQTIKYGYRQVIDHKRESLTPVYDDLFDTFKPVRLIRGFHYSRKIGYCDRMLYRTESDARESRNGVLLSVLLKEAGVKS